MRQSPAQSHVTGALHGRRVEFGCCGIGLWQRCSARGAVAGRGCSQRRFVLRTYDRMYEYSAPSGADFEAAFMASPKSVAMPEEPQSEGIDYRSGGRGLISSGEGRQAPIFTIGCTP